MIKRFTAALVVLCLLFTCTALADVTSTAVLEGSGWNLQLKTGMLDQYENHVYNLYDPYGNLVAGPYTSIYNASAKYIKVETEGGEFGYKGIITTDGTVLVEAAYDYITVDGDWAICALYGKGTENDCDIKITILGGNGDKAYRTLDTVCIVNLVSGECVAVFENRTYLNSRTDGEYIIVSDRKQKYTAYSAQGKLDKQIKKYYSTISESTVPVSAKYFSDAQGYKLVDANGNALCDKVFDTICESDFKTSDMAKVKINDQYGLISITGEILLDCEYDDILSYYAGDRTIYSHDGVCAALKGEKELVIVKNGVKKTIALQNDTKPSFIGYSVLLNVGDKYSVALPDGTVRELGTDDLSKYTVGEDVYVRYSYKNSAGSTETVITDNMLNALFTTEGYVSMSDTPYFMVKLDGVYTVYSLK